MWHDKNTVKSPEFKKSFFIKVHILTYMLQYFP